MYVNRFYLQRNLKLGEHRPSRAQFAVIDLCVKFEFGISFHLFYSKPYGKFFIKEKAVIKQIRSMQR